MKATERTVQLERLPLKLGKINGRGAQRLGIDGGGGGVAGQLPKIANPTRWLPIRSNLIQPNTESFSLGRSNYCKSMEYKRKRAPFCAGTATGGVMHGEQPPSVESDLIAVTVCRTVKLEWPGSRRSTNRKEHPHTNLQVAQCTSGHFGVRRFAEKSHLIAPNRT